MEWAAEVLACGEREPGTWSIEVRCRNGFDEATSLEALSPCKPVRAIAISNLQHVEDEPPISVVRANRAMERYRFDCNESLEPHTIIRMPK